MNRANRIHADYPGGKSVWWRWTASSTGSVTISTANSSFDTLLGIYTGAAVDALSFVASDTNSTGKLTSKVRFATVAGTTYHIAVDGYNLSSGSITLLVTPSANPPVRPVNDNFASNTLLTGNTPSVSILNDYATKEPGEPNHAGIAGGKSLWWRWTAINSGLTTVSTSGSNFDTLLAVYSGATVDGLSLVASNNDFGTSNTSRVTFNATAGATYMIAVDGNFASSGTISLSVTGFIFPPPNDNFASPSVLSGMMPSTTGTNAGATKETGEPNHAGNGGGKSVWWRWTAPVSAQWIVTTVGSNFDTTLGIYTGSALSNLVFVASDDDAGPGATSQITFNAVAGVTYKIAVDGFDGAFGDITLAASTTAAAPPNDSFANAITLTGDAPSTTGTNLGATKETGEPNHAGDAGGHSVWWRWTATQTGYASISTGGSNFDTLLAVYTGSAVNSLTAIAANDQANGTNQSQLVFSATAGSTYYLAVDGWQGEQGNVALAINGPLPLAQASVLTLDNSAAERPLDLASFYVYLRDPQLHPVSVTVSLDGSATANVDYTLDVPLVGHNATVVFAPNESIKVLTITPVADDEFTEFDETILPSLAAGSEYEIGTGTAAAIILHDDTPYSSAWAQQFGPAFTGAATDPLADPNGNGVINLLEFAFNGDPLAAGDLFTNGLPLLPVMGVGYFPDPSDGNMIKLYSTITFNRRTDAAQLSYLVQSSASLPGDWIAAGAVLVSSTTAGMPTGMERVTYRSLSSLSNQRAPTPPFMRVKVTAP